MFKTKDHWTALLFLAALLATSLVLLASFLPEGGGGVRFRGVSPAVATKTLPVNPRAMVPHKSGRVAPRECIPFSQRLAAWTNGAETALSARLDEHHFFIQLYGGAQKLATRRTVEDIADPKYSVVELADGSLSFVNSETGWDTEANAHNLRRFQSVLKQKDIELLYIQAPQKVAGDGAGQLPYGVTDTGNQCADELLAALEVRDVPTMDLRLNFEHTGRDWGEFFFRTDHHWTPEAAFLAYQSLCKTIETYSRVTPSPTGGKVYKHYKVAERYTDADLFSKTVYRNYFLGSHGKRTGTLYGGMDDIEMWVPKFATRFRYQSSSGGFDKTGPFAQSLLFPERVAEWDPFSSNPYTLYSGGDYPLGIITNHYNPDGPRILLIRDSFACALAPFLALPCSALFTVDLRYFKDDLSQYIRWLKPDLVFVLYIPGSARVDSMFQFFPTHSGRTLKELNFGTVPYVAKPSFGKNDELSVNSLAKSKSTYYDRG